MDISDLQKFSIFKNVDKKTLEQLIHSHSVEEYEQGEQLISRFKTNKYVYLLLEGEAKACMNVDDEPLNIIHSGDSMGEISVLDGHPASVYVIATKPTKVLRINQEDIWLLTKNSHEFTKNLLQILVNCIRMVNEQVDSSIQLQKKMIAMANRDELTGLYNRRWFDEQFNDLLGRCIEAGKDFSFIMIDIDHFKQVNDVYGHAAGDLVLEQMGLILRNHARAQDAAVRYGGEEMAFILPETNLERTVNIAERLRKAVEQYEFVLADNIHIQVTASMGCSTYTGSEDKQQLMKIADDALYQAKANGRNQVRC